MNSLPSDLAGLDVDELAPQTFSVEDENPFATMMAGFDEAADRIGLDPDVYTMLRNPDREIRVSLPTQLDDGRLAVFDGWRVQHNAGLGPYFGPLRLQRSLRVEELRAIAGWMTWKCAVLNIPFGGSAGGIRISPGRHTRGEVERVVRRYVASMMADVGPDRDVFSSDVATDEQIMAWIMDTVSMHERATQNAVVCGKPMALGGSHGHASSVAEGIRTLLVPALEFAGIARRPARIIIQGAGMRGGNLASLLAQDGHRIIGLSDVHGALYNADGLDVASLLRHRAEYGSLRGAEGDFERITNEEMLVKECEALIPCAAAGTVHLRVARQLQAAMIIEGAHGAVSSRADRILAERKIRVVPDILATGGGAVVNYFEWVQNRRGFNWDAQTVHSRLVGVMGDAWKEVSQLAQEQNCRLRMAAQMLAVRRVSNADRLRGVYA